MGFLRCLHQHTEAVVCFLPFYEECSWFWLLCPVCWVRNLMRSSRVPNARWTSPRATFVPASLPQSQPPRSRYTEKLGEKYLGVARLFWMPLHSLWSPRGIGSPRISPANGTLFWESLDFLMTLEKQPSPAPGGQHYIQAAVSVPLPAEPFSSHRFHILQLPLVFSAANHLFHRPFLPPVSLVCEANITLPHFDHQTCTLGGTILHSAD